MILLSGTCSEGKKQLFKYFDFHDPACSDSYWLGNQDAGDYNGSWTEPLSEALDTPTQWVHQSSWKLRTLPFAGNLATYSGGGYVLTMPRDPELHEGKH